MSGPNLVKSLKIFPIITNIHLNLTKNHKTNGKKIHLFSASSRAPFSFYHLRFQLVEDEINR